MMRQSGRRSFSSVSPSTGAGDGVDHQIVAAQPAVQTADLLCAVALALRQSQLLISPAASADPGSQGGEAPGRGLPNPAEAGDEHPSPVDGDRHLLHSQLDRPLRRGDCVGHRQLLPGEVVPKDQPPASAIAGGDRVYPAAAQDLGG